MHVVMYVFVLCIRPCLHPFVHPWWCMHTRRLSRWQVSYWNGVAEADTSFDRIPDAPVGVGGSASLLDTISGVTSPPNEPPKGNYAGNPIELETHSDVLFAKIVNLLPEKPPIREDGGLRKMTPVPHTEGPAVASKSIPLQSPIETASNVTVRNPDAGLSSVSKAAVNFPVSVTVDSPTSTLSSDMDIAPPVFGAKTSYFEPDPVVGQARIQIKNLRKVRPIRWTLCRPELIYLHAV